MKDSEGEDNMKIHAILEVPFGDERTPACLMDRRRNQENSLRGIKFGCSGKDLKTSEGSETKCWCKPVARKQRTKKMRMIRKHPSINCRHN